MCKIWDTDFMGGSNVVDVHQKLAQKLNDNAGAPRYIATVRGGIPPGGLIPPFLFIRDCCNDSSELHIRLMEGSPNAHATIMIRGNL